MGADDVKLDGSWNVDGEGIAVGVAGMVEVIAAGVATRGAAVVIIGVTAGSGVTVGSGVKAGSGVNAGSGLDVKSGVVVGRLVGAVGIATTGNGDNGALGLAGVASVMGGNVEKGDLGVEVAVNVGEGSAIGAAVNVAGVNAGRLLGSGGGVSTAVVGLGTLGAPEAVEVEAATGGYPIVSGEITGKPLPKLVGAGMGTGLAVLFWKLACGLMGGAGPSFTV